MNDNTKLFFSRMGGLGELTCLSCHHSEPVLSFIKSIPFPTKGFQCQECGKFHRITKYLNAPDKFNCDCGGNLSRDQPIFCSSCNANTVEYNCTLIT